MRDWAGKLPGAVGRIAAIYHCCENAERLRRGERDDQFFPPTPDRYHLAGCTMKTAISLARKLIPHAVHTYAIMGEGGDIQAARRVLRWIEGTGADEFTARDCHAALRGTFPRREDLRPALGVLMERGYIRRSPPPAKRAKGRPSEPYQVNPVIRPHL